MLEQTRRDFLKATSLAALGAAFVDSARRTRRKDGGTGSSNEPGTDLAGLVNLLQGTDSNYYFSRGNTLPIAAMPFGMAHWTLQSRSDTPWMFQPGDRRIQGFRCTHQLSPWLSDYGHAAFLPFAGEPSSSRTRVPPHTGPKRPNFAHTALRLKLLRYQADVELVPTERCCLITANLPMRVRGGLLIEIPGKSGAIEPDNSRRVVRFESRANEGGVPDNFATYYVVQFPEPWQSFEMRDGRQETE